MEGRGTTSALTSATSSTGATESKGTARTVSGSKARMTTELKIFVERYKQLTPNLLEHCDPLAKFGLHTDRSETLAKKIAAMCGGQGSTYILDDQLQIASDQTSNTIKINIDAFLKIHYPREIGNTVIREVPEFIIRTLRLLILNIEFHLKENHVEQKKHFEYVKEICLYLIETNNIWVPENKGLFSFGNSPGQELSSAFCTLCETVLKDIDVKIEQLAATLKVNTLPNAVEELKTVEKNLTILFSRFLLLHIASKDIPEDFFINDALNKLFADKDLTFQKLTSSNLREDIKNVFQSDERQAFSRSREEISQGIFHLVKFAFIGTERSKIRKDMTSSFILHVKRELNARALQTVAQTPQRQLTNAHPAEEKKTEIAAKSDTPTITSSALTSVTPSSSVTLDRHSLPAETQKFAEQYHARVQLDTQSRALVVNALPECIRKIYNNPDPTVHTEAMINSVKLYVDVIMTGLLTLEELIHARINLSYTKNYSLRGGPFLTKASMPVPNTAGSILSTLNKIKLVIHELRKIDIKSVVPGLSHGFIGNNRMALATGYRISKEIDTKGNNGIQNIQLSISPHEIEQDADDMFENLAGSVLCQTAMQGLTMSKSPIFDATIAMLSAAKAISFKNQLEHKAADDRVSNFKNTLPMGIPVPRQLTYTDHGFRPIQELRKLTSSDFENSFLRNYALTIGQALAGTIVHNASQPYLQVTTEGGNILDYPLDESGKRWIEEKQKPALPPRPPQSILTSASSSSSSTHTASSTSTENTSTSVSSSYLNLASAPSTAPQSQTSPSSSSAPSAFTSTTTIAGSSSASPAEIKYFPPACDDQSEILLLLADNRERTLRNEILHRDQKLLDHSQDWNIKIMKLKFWYFFPGLGIPLIILSPVLIGAAIYNRLHRKQLEEDKATTLVYSSEINRNKEMIEHNKTEIFQRENAIQKRAPIAGEQKQNNPNSPLSTAAPSVPRVTTAASASQSSSSSTFIPFAIPVPTPISTTAAVSTALASSTSTHSTPSCLTPALATPTTAAAAAATPSAASVYQAYASSSSSHSTTTSSGLFTTPSSASATTETKIVNYEALATTLIDRMDRSLKTELKQLGQIESNQDWSKLHNLISSKKIKAFDHIDDAIKIAIFKLVVAKLQTVSPTRQWNPFKK